jgi:HNH endonuclease
MQVFQRDYFRSVISGKRGQRWYLVAHHIIPFADILQDFLALHPNLDLENDADKAELFRLAMNYKPFWDVNNGQTMLRDEHIEFHQKTRIEIDLD